MKSVVILVNEFAPAQGGVGNQAYYLAKYLCEVCTNVSVITFYQTEHDFTFDGKQPFKIYRRKEYKWGIFRLLTLTINVIKIIKEEKPDTIIVSNYFFLWLLPVIRLFYIKARYATIIHGTELRHTNIVFKSLSYLGLFASEKIIAVSHYTRSILKFNFLRKRTDVCHIGIPDQLLIPETEHKECSKLKLATIGTFTAKKGYINVLKILPYLLEEWPEGTYKVSGINNVLEFYNAANKFSTGILLKSRIEISDSFTNTNLEHIQLFFKDVCIYLALGEQTKRGDVEGYGIALLEANARGVPVIATNNFGFRETVKDGYSGILVNPHSKDEVIAAIRHVLNNYPAFSKKARVWAFEHRWSKLYKAYYDVIKD